MDREWINLYKNLNSDWHHGENAILEFRQPAPTPASNFHGRTVRIYEISASGQIIIAPLDVSPLPPLDPLAMPMTSYGVPEVFLKIGYEDYHRYLSAPLNTFVDVHYIRSLELGVVVTVGMPGVRKIHYRGAVNAHCVYRII